MERTTNSKSSKSHLPYGGRRPTNSQSSSRNNSNDDDDDDRVMTTVQVTDEAGKSLGRVKVGDTKLQALQRLSPRQGILVDKDDLGLLDSDTVSIERGPYVLKINAESGEIWFVRLLLIYSIVLEVIQAVFR